MGNKKHRSAGCEGTAPRFTPQQGQYLAYLHLYWKLHRIGPTLPEIARYFHESLERTEQVMGELEQLQFVQREAGRSRFWQLQIAPTWLPELTEEASNAASSAPQEGGTRAEVLAIGDELTSGVRLDTNSQWLSQQLEGLGVRVWYHTTVGDEMDALVAAISAAVDRADVVVLTGGIGPTADDLTREALAVVANQPLVSDAAVVEHIGELFARRGRVMPERNLVQAQFPEGSEVIANPHGTAPGLHLEIPTRHARAKAHLFALPGVPAELKEMWVQSVALSLEKLLGDQRCPICHRTLRCFGAGESDIEQRLPDLVRRGRDPSVGITASHGTISLRVTAAGSTVAACHEKMASTIATIHECLGPLVFGEEDDTLPVVVRRLLRQHHLSLATAEWATEGLLASWLSSNHGDQPYHGGLVIADQIAARKAFQVKAFDNMDPSAGSHASCVMASGAREQLQADLGLAVGPPPPHPSNPSTRGEIHFALATPAGIVNRAARFASHPAIRRDIAAKKALDLTRLWLLEQLEPTSD